MSGCTSKFGKHIKGLIIHQSLPSVLTACHDYFWQRDEYCLPQLLEVHWEKTSISCLINRFLHILACLYNIRILHLFCFSQLHKWNPTLVMVLLFWQDHEPNFMQIFYLLYKRFLSEFGSPSGLQKDFAALPKQLEARQLAAGDKVWKNVADLAKPSQLFVWV